MNLLLQWIIYLGIPVVFFAIVFFIIAYLSYAERKIGGFIQLRVGPARAGPKGILQPVADGIKFLFKEDVVMGGKDKLLYIISPAILFVSTFTAMAAIPFGISLTINQFNIQMNIVNLSVGILFVLAFSSLAVYGIVLGGWASGSKYPLMGALRSAVQVLSYEVPLTLTVASMILTYGSFNLAEIAQKQEGILLFLPNWGIFLQPLAFVIFMVSAFAESNRVPFDLPEEESVLVSGYHTEYSAMKFAMFFMSEYGHMILASSLIVLLFFGGWNIPYLNMQDLVKLLSFMGGGWAKVLASVIGFVVFFIKVSIILFLYIWVRWTFPRFRFDQLVSICWKVLVPLSVLNLIVTAGVITWLFS